MHLPLAPMFLLMVVIMVEMEMEETAAQEVAVDMPIQELLRLQKAAQLAMEEQVAVQIQD